MIGNIGTTLRTMLDQKAVLAFSICAFLSALWSQDPLLTLRKAMLLLLLFSFAWFFASYYSSTDQMHLLIATGIFTAFASIAMVVFLPRCGIDYGGAWKGVFSQKNGLGWGMFFLFSGLPFRRIENSRELLKMVLKAIFPFTLILLSQSKESLILALLVISVRLFGGFRGTARRDEIPFVLYVISLTILGIAMGGGAILSLIGRDSTLTGRTQEWAVLVPYALRHIWLGYGYQAFWTGSGDSMYAMRIIGAGIRGSDSGYLDIMLQFGLVGFVMILSVLIVYIRDLFRLLRARIAPLAAYWYAALIISLFVGFFVGSTFLYPVGLGSFIFALACAGLRIVLRETCSDATVADFRVECGKEMNSSSYRS
jgi:O-antigen ligase